jgi:hypothetical protein
VHSIYGVLTSNERVCVNLATEGVLKIHTLFFRVYMGHIFGV